MSLFSRRHFFKVWWHNMFFDTRSTEERKGVSFTSEKMRITNSRTFEVICGTVFEHRSWQRLPWLTRTSGSHDYIGAHHLFRACKTYRRRRPGDKLFHLWLVSQGQHFVPDVAPTWVTPLQRLQMKDNLGGMLCGKMLDRSLISTEDDQETEEGIGV